MPRKKRIDAPGALHHIMLRGIERRKIFRDDLDRQAFLDRLGKLLTETSTPCFAWALLPNHAHLLLRSSGVSFSTVMRRLLTGYAVTFNLRHKRHGHLFQNRYKSILCEEDAYLLELVRYIHLNPLRAKLVRDMAQLDEYPYAGHSAIVGTVERDWQDVGHVLEHFGSTGAEARREYRQFVQDGIKMVRRPELVGGGLIRSLGGWSEAKSRLEDEPRMMSDERILGDGDFVESALVAAR
jgi:putative transposase